MNPVNVTLGAAPVANATAVGLHPMQHQQQSIAPPVGGNAVANLLRAGMQQLGVPMQTAEDMAKLKALADSMGGVLFDKISIKGSKWTLNCNGQVAAIHPMPNLEVIIVDIAPHTSREYYDKPYTPGEKVKPACWSDNGLAPHPSVPVETRQSSRCDTCAMNQKGSRKKMSDKEGSATGVACGFFRRIVVVPQVQGYTDKPFALDLPSSSLWERENGPYGTGLENFVKGVLSANGIMFDMLVTNLCFDPSAEMPKVLFNPAWQRDSVGNPVAPIFLNEQQRGAIKDMARSDAVKKMLEVSDVNYETDIPALAAPQQQQLLAAPQQPVNIGGGSATPQPVQVVPQVQQEEMVNVEGHGLMTRSQYNALVAQYEAEQAAAAKAAAQPQEEMVNVEGHGLMTRSQYEALVAQYEAQQKQQQAAAQPQEEMVNVEGHGLMTRSQYNALVAQYEAEEARIAAEQAAAAERERIAAEQAAAAAAAKPSNVTALPGIATLAKPTTVGAAPVAGLAAISAPAGQTGAQPQVSAAQPAPANLGNVQGAATLTTLAAPVGLPSIGTATSTTSQAAAQVAPAATVAATPTSTQVAGVSALPAVGAAAAGEVVFEQPDGLADWLGDPNAQA